MSDDRDRDRDVLNARLLADLDRQGRLAPCGLCGTPPLIQVDPDSRFGRPMALEQHDPGCEAGERFFDALPAAEVEIPSEVAEDDWARWKEREEGNDE